MKTIVIIAVVLLLVNALINTLGLFTDDSDKSGWKRSGFRVLTDHKTGVQYLCRYGAIQPRLNADGTVIKVSE